MNNAIPPSQGPQAHPSGSSFLTSCPPPLFDERRGLESCSPPWGVLGGAAQGHPGTVRCRNMSLGIKSCPLNHYGTTQCLASRQTGQIRLRAHMAFSQVWKADPPPASRGVSRGDAHSISSSQKWSRDRHRETDRRFKFIAPCRETTIHRAAHQDSSLRSQKAVAAKRRVSFRLACYEAGGKLVVPWTGEA